jgi:glucosyl-3-phosphoglycerate synthase
VDLGIDYEHKHQDTGIGSAPPEKRAQWKGLMRMAREIASTLFRALASEGTQLPPSFFHSLRVAYIRSAQNAIRQYNDVAAINGLIYDRHTEDTLAEAFGRALERAADDFLENPLGAPAIPNWNRVHSAIPGIYEKIRGAVEQDNDR